MANLLSMRTEMHMGVHHSKIKNFRKLIKFEQAKRSSSSTVTMATQNIAPPAQTQSKGSSASQMAPKDGHSVAKRLNQDLMKLMMSGDDTISAFPDGDNLFHWVATITGGPGTVYEGQKYKLSLSFPPGYPYTAPTIKFSTSCYHPNVDTHGNICLDILKEKWSALYDVRTILLSIQSLLAEPNNDSPLNAEAAELWSNQAEYKVVLTQKYEQAVKKDS